MFREQLENATTCLKGDFNIGFDDTNRSDTEVLREIASWLTASYSSDIKLRGIIYLHRISDRRMPGSARKNLIMFKKLCGVDALSHVILATTMWENVNPKDGIERERELRETEDFWGWMLQQGSKLERHTNDEQSAMRLLSLFASPTSNASDFVVDLQRQMVDQGKALDETAAGITLEGELAKERAKFQREMQILKEDLTEAARIKDEQAARELQKQKKEMNKKIERLNQEQAHLKTSLQQEHEKKYQEMQDLLMKQKRATEERERAANERDARQRQLLDDEQAARKIQEAEHKRQLNLLRKKLQAASLSQLTQQTSVLQRQQVLLSSVSKTARKTTVPIKSGQSLAPLESSIKKIYAASIVGDCYSFSSSDDALARHVYPASHLQQILNNVGYLKDYVIYIRRPTRKTKS